MNKKPNRSLSQKLFPFMLIGNIVIISIFILSLGILIQQYNSEISEQNTKNIQDIAVSSGASFEDFFRNKQERLNNISKHLESESLSVFEALDFTSNYNQQSEIEYQIIDENYSGFSTKKADESFKIVNYSSKDYLSLQGILKRNGTVLRSDTINFSPEFSNQSNGLKSVALYCYINLKDDSDNLKEYTILQISSTNYLKDSTKIISQYSNLSSSLLNFEGTYILSNGSFRSDNFFDYIKEFYNISLDDASRIHSEIDEKKVGSFTLSSDGETTHFSYYVNETRGWYTLIAVPTNSFLSSNYRLGSITQTLLCVFLLLFYNVAFLYILNKDLKKSIINEAQSSRAKTDFLSRISHDMRTPMNGIIGMSSFISEANSLEEAKEYNRSIKESGDYLLLLINDTLDINRIEAGKMELKPDVVECDILISNIIEELSFSASEKSITLKCQYDCLKGQEIIVDRLRFKQVLVNLLTNSIKYTNRGGEVSFIVENISHENDICVDRYIVKDNGIGMSKKFMERMYDPFEQEKTVGTTSTGSGLGLSIVSRLITLMNGTISCQSELGKGTTFTIDIPYTKKVFVPKEKNTQKRDYSELNGKKILLAEDNEINKKIIVKLLEAQGVIVKWAADGKKALNLFIDSPIGYYDCILMDIRMPIMDGLAATRSIRKINRIDAPTIKIIALTADAFQDDMDKSFQAGMNNHLSKPISKEELYNALLD